MNRLQRHLYTVASVISLLALWYAGGVAFPQVFPGLPETFAALVVVLTTPGPYDNMFYFHVWKTIEMLFASLFVSMIAGTFLGIALGRNETLESTLSMWIYGWLAIPSLVIVFVSAIWIGFNANSGYFAVPVVITPFIALNMWEGARTLDADLAEMAEFFGAGRVQTFTDIIIPQLAPFLFASFRSALSVGWKITLLVEAFLLTRGVGFMFRRYFDQYDLPTMMSWLIIFVVFLIVVEYGVLAPLHERVMRWRPDAEGVRVAE
ncbi:ABC transporter permease subunit [Halobellus sp. GM3]|uniref:ABC transporter permease subunit n=1 Tax=Halobellus sp. GM3 TaxID=3458410 RepID=UPI00403E048D